MTAGTITPADTSALTSLQAAMVKVPNVTKVLNAGQSSDGQAVQLVALANPAVSGNQDYATDLVDGCARYRERAPARRIAARTWPERSRSPSTSRKRPAIPATRCRRCPLVFVILLLVLIFRSFTLALATVLPAAFSVAIAGPLVAEAAKHGLQVSPIAQLLLIVLVIGAGTDYGLFLVFRVREELRQRPHDTERRAVPGQEQLRRSALADVAHPRPEAREAIVRAVTRVGESISASALTVIAAVLTLLLASFSFYSDLAWPFAIAVAVILVAGLTLLPALLSIRLSLLAVKRTLFKAMFGKPKMHPVEHSGPGQERRLGPGRRPDRAAARPRP